MVKLARASSYLFTGAMSPIPLEMYSSATSTDPSSPSKTASSPIPPTEAASAIMLRPVWTKEDDSPFAAPLDDDSCCSFSVPLFSVPFSIPVLFLALSNTVRTRFLTPNLDSFRSLLCRTALDHVVSTLNVLRLRCGVFLWTLMEGLVSDDCCRASMVLMRESLTVDTNNNGGWCGCDDDPPPPPPPRRAPKYRGGGDDDDDAPTHTIPVW